MKSHCIQIFAKLPVPGKVKTRMQTSLSPQDCARLSKTMIRHSIRVACEVEGADVQLWCFPDPLEDFFEKLTTKFPIVLMPQRGSNIGERMNFALRDALNRYDSVQLIGSDCPFYSKEYLKQAVEILQTERQITLGPAEDGGYLQIGCNWLIPSDIFDNITWGTETVFRETVDKLEAHGIVPKLLPKLADIDRPEDLMLFR